jgi:nucleolin
MSQKLFVRNLSWSVTEDDLYELFGQAGTVNYVKIPTRREDGKPRGFAFIEMGSPEEAQQAIRQCNGTALYNRDIVVDFQDETKGGDAAGGGGGYGASAPPAKNAKLFVRNVAYSVTDGDLERYFQQAGSIVSVKIPTDRETGESKGFAFIEMASADEAENAITQLNNSALGGKAIIIEYQDPNRSRSGGGRPAGAGAGGYGGGNRGGGGGGRW